jgi:hypothetical protein
MDRAELERLDRDELVRRAERAGVVRPRVLTRPELVDELLLRSAADQATKRRTRGLFGLARDLIARVVERGLHLPDAADRIRAVGEPFLTQPHPSAPAALPTVTLAEIYAAQGYRERAIETLEGVLAREPDHPVANVLLARLRDTTYPVPPPKLPPEEEVGSVAASMQAAGAAGATAADVAPGEPSHMLDDSPLPPRYDVDECVAIPVDPKTLYVYWEVRDKTLAFVRGSRPGGTIALRILVVVPTWDGPQSSVRTHDVANAIGDFFVRDLPAGCVVRAAIGYLVEGAFEPIAHSPPLETPPGAPSPLVADTLVRWTSGGLVALSADDEDAASIRRAVARARTDAARAQRYTLEPTDVDHGTLGPPLGASERWANVSSS